MDVKFTAASLYIITSTTTMMTAITFLTLGARGAFEASRDSLIFMLISATIKFSLSLVIVGLICVFFFCTIQINFSKLLSF